MEVLLQVQRKLNRKSAQSLLEKAMALINMAGFQLRFSPLEADAITEIDTIIPIESATKKILDSVPVVEEVNPSIPINEWPMIGIMTQPYDEVNDYIMASYVKFIQAAGARVVPIVWRDSDEDILNLVSKLNGAVFPGGAIAFKNEDGTLSEYGRKAELIINKAKEMTDRGSNYPIMGICLGIQLIVQHEAPFKDTVEMFGFDNVDEAATVTLKQTSESKLFSKMPQHLINAVQKEKLTYYHHHDGVVPSIWNKYSSLRDNYHLLATSHDRKGDECIVFVENKKYPIWGLQFHSEKNSFSWRPTSKVPHSQTSIEFSQFLANFFVMEAKKNFNRFDSEEEAFDHMIEHVPLKLNREKKHDVYLFTSFIIISKFIEFEIVLRAGNESLCWLF